MAGLEDTILETQKTLLAAAVEAKVSRFIPSDYSIDFTVLEEGRNRNLDFRREFHKHLDQAPIEATTIFCGAFMDLLTTDMPLILFNQKRILCWGDPKQVLEFTFTDDVADFTAEAALEEQTPRFLKIAGDRLSCNDFVNLLTDITGEKYKILKPGGIGLFNFLIRVTKFFSPSKDELYPAWQGMQYMRDMMEGKLPIQNYDQDRYPNLKWISVKEFLIKEGVKSKK